jgi:hypothetical protein
MFVSVLAYAYVLFLTLAYCHHVVVVFDHRVNIFDQLLCLQVKFSWVAIAVSVPEPYYIMLSE